MCSITVKFPNYPKCPKTDREKLGICQHIATASIFKSNSLRGKRRKNNVLKIIVYHRPLHIM